MNVNILPPDVIAKIAAGEVVDRPASVVKELVENSLDAGATSIEVHLKDAGKELIHIKDNGHGIARADLEIMFQRHATSKITSMDDLETLNSMGFRGEALYSIAAVSDVQLRTQAKEEAWEIHVRGGVRQDLKPAAPFGHGTDIKTSELFFNTPARRKFLKATASEISSILNVIIPYALLYPSKRFVVTHAGRTLLDIKPTNDPLDRFSATLNVERKFLIGNQFEDKENGVSVNLICGDINIQRPRRDLQFICINGRPVESKGLSFSANDIYKLILAPGVYGAFFLDITLDPSTIDANIHPTKREVRVKNEYKLNYLVRHLLEATLMQQGSVKTVSGASTTVSETIEGIPASKIIFNPQSTVFNAPPSQRYGGNFDNQINLAFNEFSAFANEQRSNQTETLHEKFSAARFVGSFMDKYQLFENGDCLLVIDHHAAQERIMYERFKKQIENGSVEIQPLLTPVLLKLSPMEQVAWEESKDKLHGIGIEATNFDADTVAIHTQPVLLKNIETAVRAILGGDDVARCDQDTLARRACKASVRAGDSLNPEQVLHQRKELLACNDPFTCPHGRPTVIEIKDSFLERQFLRS